jgi:hypothetical protein
MMFFSSLLSEAQYASVKKKHIIEVHVQSGYTPDGWITYIHCKGKHDILDDNRDTTDGRSEDEKLEKLLDRIKKASVTCFLFPSMNVFMPLFIIYYFFYRLIQGM